jgi:ABC-type uncharacterized transport system ATPase subunit
MTAPVLDVSDIVVRFSGLTAVDGLSFALHPGRGPRCHRP